MSIIDTLVTTRGAGTYYNAADLNRVEGAVSYIEAQFNALPGTLAAYLASFGIAPDSIFEVPYAAPLSMLTVKTDWDAEYVPMASGMERYISNINAIRAVIALPSDTPDTPADMANLTYGKANDIEKILQEIDDATQTLENVKKAMAAHTAAAWYFSGEIFGGEVA